MTFSCKPARLAIYVNTARKTAAQIQQETGCTALINGGLYDMSTFRPVCHLKVDGKVLAADQYKYWGYGWTGDGFPSLVSDYAALDNYIACVCLVRNAKAEPLYYSAAMGGARPRTAFGTFADGRVWLYADDANLTPEQLQTLAIKAGVRDAIMLDGDLYTMLYSRLTYTRYKGAHGLSEEELAALLANADESCVLRIVMSVADGAANRIEFYPISADRVAVQVKIGAYSDVSCRFVVYRTALDDIFRAYERLMEGKAFDFEDRYE